MDLQTINLWLAAAASEQVTDVADAVQLGYGWALLRMLAALVVVCLAAYLLLRFGLKRLGAPRVAAQSMRAIDRLPLGSNQTLWIVEVSGQRLLVGAGDGGPRLLSLLPSQAQIDSPMSAGLADGVPDDTPPAVHEPASARHGKSFSALLKRGLGKVPQAAVSKPAPSAGGTRTQDADPGAASS